MTHRLCTTDPISLHNIDDPTGKPYIVEGDRYNDVTIYFESEENRQAYLAIPVEHPEQDTGMSLDNPTDIMIDEG